MIWPFFCEKEPNEICNHLSKKGPKGKFFFAPDELENHTTKKEAEKERARKKKGGEEKKEIGCTFSFHNGYFERYFLAETEKNCLTEEVYLALVYSKIRLDVCV